MSYKPTLNIDALIFALDDVLIDISQSYREVVRQTVQVYLEQTIGLKPSKEPLLTLEEVTLLHKAGHFTGYQDLATAFIIYFAEQLPPVPVPTFPSKIHVPAIIAYLQLAGGRLGINIDELREQKDIPELARSIAEAGGGMAGAHAALPKENRHLVVDEGKITKSNLVGRIFQELYLGKRLFEQIYEEPPVVVQTTGYIEQETLLMDPGILSEIGQKMPLGVIGGVPRLQLEQSLQARNIQDHFQVLISLDELHEAKANPLPDPWSLLEVARCLIPRPTRTAYMGASVADIKAAKAANQTVPFTAIGCLWGAHDKEALRQIFEEARVDIILGHPNHVKELIVD